MRTALGLIGYPLSQSFSPGWFQEKFQREGLLDWSYDLMRLPDISALPGWLASQENLLGVNVTIPHKQSILPYLDWIAPQALRIGAVNTVLINDEGKLHGYNTDAPAFKESLEQFVGPEPTGKALILGNGGASQAVQDVLRETGRSFTVVSRSKARNTMTYADLQSTGIETYQLIINTTPLGMFPEVHDCPAIPYEQLNSSHFLYDLIYTPEETMFLEMGRMAGARTKNGLEMLYLQAEKSWQIWTRK
ncbi:MAG: shikimate dehydrogenase [Saprospiraceae bacterium]|nr:shikimate dehydrogenase [Saprospiraceae bacterium]